MMCMMFPRLLISHTHTHRIPPPYICLPPCSPSSPARRYPELEDEEDKEKVESLLSTELHPHQKQGIQFMLDCERRRRKRGVLMADDMGMGKTLQSIGLCYANPRPTDWVGGGTLVVVPKSLLSGWEEQLKEHSKEDPEIHVQYGNDRITDDVELIEGYDFVLTTYDVVRIAATTNVDHDEEEKDPRGGGKKKKKKTKVEKDHSILEKTTWWRIIADEAQVFKNANTNISKSLCLLKGHNRVVLSGTPIQNGLSDLYSILRFLRYPFYGCNKANLQQSVKQWKKRVENPLKGDGNGRDDSAGKAQRRVRCMLDKLLIRRCKTDRRKDGTRLVNLPNLHMRDHVLEFNDDERSFYTSMLQKTSLAMNKYLRAGTVMRNFHQILVLLLRLRQACAHADLTTKRYVVCGICEDDLEELLEEDIKLRKIPVCNHFICDRCFKELGVDVSGDGEGMTRGCCQIEVDRDVNAKNNQIARPQASAALSQIYNLKTPIDQWPYHLQQEFYAYREQMQRADQMEQNQQVCSKDVA